MLTDERYKQLMEDVGLPNSISLLQALKQCAMEAALIERAAPVPAMPIPKQEPAVPVPDNKHDSESPKNIGNEIHNIATALAYSGSESIADELGSIAVRLWALDPSPRITEQDAREIIEDYIGYCDGKLLKPQSSVVMGMYIKNECTAILNKLNANAVPSQAEAMPEYFSAIEVLRENIRNPDRGVEYCGIFDNNKTRAAIGTLLSAAPKTE